MLARITGTLEHVDAAAATLWLPSGDGAGSGGDSGGGGVAHEALVSPALSAALQPRLGQSVTLHTLELLESANQGASFTPRLLGFASREDRRFFELLIRVKGLGPKRALRALAAPTHEIARAIVEGDVKALTRLPEVGKKLAESIIAELRDKAAPFTMPTGADGAPHAQGAISGAIVVETRGAFSPGASQAIAALVRLGEPRAEAERMVERALHDDAKLGSPDAILAAALAVRGV